MAEDTSGFHEGEGNDAATPASGQWVSLPLPQLLGLCFSQPDKAVPLPSLFLFLLGTIVRRLATELFTQKA